MLLHAAALIVSRKPGGLISSVYVPLKITISMNRFGKNRNNNKKEENDNIARRQRRERDVDRKEQIKWEEYERGAKERKENLERLQKEKKELEEKLQKEREDAEKLRQKELEEIDLARQQVLAQAAVDKDIIASIQKDMESQRRQDESFVLTECSKVRDDVEEMKKSEEEMMRSEITVRQKELIAESELRSKATKELIDLNQSIKGMLENSGTKFAEMKHRYETETAKKLNVELEKLNLAGEEITFSIGDKESSFNDERLKIISHENELRLKYRESNATIESSMKENLRLAEAKLVEETRLAEAAATTQRKALEDELKHMRDNDKSEVMKEREDLEKVKYDVENKISSALQEMESFLEKSKDMLELEDAKFRETIHGDRRNQDRMFDIEAQGRHNIEKQLSEARDEALTETLGLKDEIAKLKRTMDKSLSKSATEQTSKLNEMQLKADLVLSDANDRFLRESHARDLRLKAEREKELSMITSLKDTFETEIERTLTDIHMKAEAKYENKLDMLDEDARNRLQAIGGMDPFILTSRRGHGGGDTSWETGIKSEVESLFESLMNEKSSIIQELDDLRVTDETKRSEFEDTRREERKNLGIIFHEMDKQYRISKSQEMGSIQELTTTFLAEKEAMESTANTQRLNDDALREEWRSDEQRQRDDAIAMLQSLADTVEARTNNVVNDQLNKMLDAESQVKQLIDDYTVNRAYHLEEMEEDLAKKRREAEMNRLDQAESDKKVRQELIETMKLERAAEVGIIQELKDSLVQEKIKISNELERVTSSLEDKWHLKSMELDRINQQLKNQDRDGAKAMMDEFVNQIIDEKDNLMTVKEKFKQYRLEAAKIDKEHREIDLNERREELSSLVEAIRQELFQEDSIRADKSAMIIAERSKQLSTLSNMQASIEGDRIEFRTSLSIIQDNISRQAARRLDEESERNAERQKVFAQSLEALHSNFLIENKETLVKINSLQEKLETDRLELASEAKKRHEMEGKAEKQRLERQNDMLEKQYVAQEAIRESAIDFVKKSFSKEVNGLKSLNDELSLDKDKKLIHLSDMEKKFDQKLSLYLYDLEEKSLKKVTENEATLTEKLETITNDNKNLLSKFNVMQSEMKQTQQENKEMLEGSIKAATLAAKEMDETSVLKLHEILSQITNEAETIDNQLRERIDNSMGGVTALKEEIIRIRNESSIETAKLLTEATKNAALMREKAVEETEKLKRADGSEIQKVTKEALDEIEDIKVKVLYANDEIKCEMKSLFDSLVEEKKAVKVAIDDRRFAEIQFTKERELAEEELKRKRDEAIEAAREDASKFIQITMSKEIEYVTSLKEQLIEDKQSCDRRLEKEREAAQKRIRDRMRLLDEEAEDRVSEIESAAMVKLKNITASNKHLLHEVQGLKDTFFQAEQNQDIAIEAAVTKATRLTSLKNAEMVATLQNALYEVQQDREDVEKQSMLKFQNEINQVRDLKDEIYNEKRELLDEIERMHSILEDSASTRKMQDAESRRLHKTIDHDTLQLMRGAIEASLSKLNDHQTNLKSELSSFAAEEATRFKQWEKDRNYRLAKERTDRIKLDREAQKRGAREKELLDARKIIHERLEREIEEEAAANEELQFTIRNRKDQIDRRNEYIESHRRLNLRDRLLELEWRG